MNLQQKEENHVVLGATGALGSAVVRELVAEKKNVRAVVRNKEKAKYLFKNMKVEIVQADALDRSQLIEATKGAMTIYHCIGLPYTKWLKLFPKIQENVIQASKAADAKLVFADNLYMYGKMRGTRISEEHPYLAESEKGQLRKRMADELLQKHQAGDLEVVIIRFGDFFGPNVVNGFTVPLFKNPLKGKAASWIGKLDKKHSLIYIEDAARSLIYLGSKKKAYGQIWLVDGDKQLTGREFINSIFVYLDKKPKMKVLSKRNMIFLGIIVPIVKEIKELSNQWEYPFIIDDSKYRSFNPDYEPTAHEQAIATTVKWFEQHAI